MRKPKTELTAEIAALKKGPQDKITLEREYRLITPLFGGGVEAGEADPITPIRGTEIRGHLRFWWRATQGGRFGDDPEKLKKAEDRIWGAASSPSSTFIAVLAATKGTPFKVRANVRGQMQEVDIGNPSSPFGYVAFPLRGDEEKRPGKVVENVTFTMRLSFKQEFRGDVKAALWAWETFGGIGARTRRGFGALQCIRSLQTAPDQAGADDWLWAYHCDTIVDEVAGHLQEFVAAGKFHEDLPHLNRSRNTVAATPVKGDAIAVWLDLIRALKGFRQSRAGKRGFGRSHWPEPDAIRKLTGQALKPRPSDRKPRDHSEPVYKPPIYKFPRTAFGLPIVFEFKRQDSHPTDTDRDPRKTELKGENHDRLASPLIIRPLACHGDRFVGLALVLDGPRIPPDGLKLQGSPRNPAAGAEDLEKDEARAIAVRNKNYDGNTDILQAFLNSLRRKK